VVGYYCNRAFHPFHDRRLPPVCVFLLSGHATHVIAIGGRAWYTELLQLRLAFTDLVFHRPRQCNRATNAFERNKAFGIQSRVYSLRLPD